VNEERYYSLWLAMVAGQNPNRYYDLLRNYGGAREIYELAAGKKLNLGANDKRAEARIAERANERYMEKCMAYLHKKGIDAVLTEDGNYPALLREIYFPPPVLFVKGRLPEEIPLPIAVIGTRKNTSYGEQAADMICKDLAKSGACIVSGMAYGIDSIASKAALDTESEFPTIAVLGSGVDVVYPKDNGRLYEKIVERGAVISEFLRGTRPSKGTFPRRNRIISGISKGVVVIEAGAKSGTFITVDHALEQGRDVFAVPGRITDASSAGTNALIREGMAKAVFSAGDILEEYGVDMGRAERSQKVDESALTPDQSVIFTLLKSGEKSIDELCELTGMEMGRLNSSLTWMELSGIIKQSPGRVFGL